MSEKQVDHGIGYVVDSKSSKARYAVSKQNFNPKKHTKVRPLQPGETVLGFRPRRIERAAGSQQAAQTQTPASPTTGTEDNTK